jgi:hypothetical protein
MSYALPVEDGEVMTGVELWRLIDDGARLEIERSMTFSGREKVRRIVFRREP